MGFVPVRKKGKLPAETRGRDYQLEYGSDRIEIHVDAIQKGDRVLLVDDLIATGGTAEAAAGLIQEMGGEVVECGFVIDLPGYRGQGQPGKSGTQGVCAVRIRGRLIFILISYSAMRFAYCAYVLAKMILTRCNAPRSVARGATRSGGRGTRKAGIDQRRGCQAAFMTISCLKPGSGA